MSRSALPDLPRARFDVRARVPGLRDPWGVFRRLRSDGQLAAGIGEHFLSRLDRLPRSEVDPASGGDEAEGTTSSETCSLASGRGTMMRPQDPMPQAKQLRPHRDPFTTRGMGT